jgi:hypothetical protein
MSYATIKKGVAGALAVAGILSAGPAGAAIINGDFETGNLSGWTAIGAAFATGSTSVTTFDSTVWTIGAAGTTMAQMNSDGAGIATIESTLGLASGSLNAFNTNPDGGSLTNGAAIYQSFTANAGDSISFAWDYVARDYVPYNDPAFAILIGPDLLASITVLASTHGLGIPVGTSGHSGWQTFSQTLTQTGSYTIAFVTTNDKDEVLDSALFIDDTAGSCTPACPPPVNGVPEPGSMALVGLGLAGFGLMKRRKSR